MVTRITGSTTVSQASVFGSIAYFGEVSASEQSSTSAQTEEILKKYETLFAENGLAKENTINAFVILSPHATPGDFFNVWNQWLSDENMPAVTVIRAGLTGTKFISMALYVACTSEIERIKLQGGYDGRLVKYNGMVYFSGQSRREGMKTLTEQTKAVMSSYDEMLSMYNLKKENIINGNIYVQDINMQDEFENVWINWTFAGHKPAGTMVEGKPLNKDDLLELNLTFADSPSVLDLLRIKPGANCCRFVKYHNIAYFTGHVCSEPGADDLYKQTKSVFQRFDAVFDEFGLQKENILTAGAYLKNIGNAPQFEKAWDEWVNGENPPTRLICGTRLLSDDFFLELAITVAYE
ncbi:MAG: hypothetical protein A2029_05865 [Chloroflexi bacterium RBG_19FT_COMBO_47_9]|nr:MAG: hypothetical protein A2Y53_06080 [Chloroflexi bacterium RBG_16_47_49]OGO59990.1 MAG: hypothetical protein A2029_05865 [Chloroflexi bacterium RBG_19FT_COMBO_47_9]